MNLYYNCYWDISLDGLLIFYKFIPELLLRHSLDNLSISFNVMFILFVWYIFGTYMNILLVCIIIIWTINFWHLYEYFMNFYQNYYSDISFNGLLIIFNVLLIFQLRKVFVCFMNIMWFYVRIIVEIIL